MKPRNPVKHKKRGPPATGKTPITGVRLAPDLRRQIEAWAERQHDRPSLSEAIRRILERGVSE